MGSRVGTRLRLKKEKKIPRLLWGYFLQITFIWNKFKWENLNNPISDISCGGGEFSHSYVIVYEYFGL
jgi:hypothetical protein